MFFVCSFLRQMFVFELKHHVNVIICCDKFAHDFSSSIKIFLDVSRFDDRQKHDVHDVSRYDTRRAFENVFLLITIIMFFVRSCVKRSFLYVTIVCFWIQRSFLC
jgi:hypothetical protein